VRFGKAQEVLALFLRLLRWSCENSEQFRLEFVRTVEFVFGYIDPGMGLKCDLYDVFIDSLMAISDQSERVSALNKVLQIGNKS
jgi:hypothetical protein